ncbi:hypothetical protein ACFQ3S_15015 [Mucilaginibacter terrae]|uniref:hypothetical protein n=1 Tax=Mucilaginibacter terrae TaxID=1955052 RepID=UPI00362A9C05
MAIVDEMDFEYLVRRVNECGRHGVANADADIYRRYERTERMYLMDVENIKNNQMRVSTKPIENMKDDFEIASNQIWRIVQITLNQAIEKFKHILSKEDAAELKSHAQLRNAAKANIENAIEAGNNILVKYKIYPK